MGHAAKNSSQAPQMFGQLEAGAAPTYKTKVPIAPIIFVVALFVPIQIYVGDLRLSAYRIALLLLIIPAALRYLNSKDIQWRIADLMILLHCAWASISLMVTGSSIATAGIFVVETAGSWLIARVYVRDVQQFKAVVRAMFWGVTLSLPFAIYETLTRDPIVLTVLDKFVSALPNVPHEQRLGLDRVQFVFDHPILYGLFCSLSFTISIYLLGKPEAGKLSWWRGVVVSVATFLSLSSGALVCIAVQLALITYDRIMKWYAQRWKVLIASAILLYIVLEAGSNRTVPEILLPYVALNPGTAWTRIAVNNAAIDFVSENIVFGNGLKPWFPTVPLPTASIDNFWLVIAFRHGLIGFLTLAGATLFSALAIGRAASIGPQHRAIATAIIVTITGFAVATATVHLWNATYCFFIFFLAFGLWIADINTNNPATHGEEVGPGQQNPLADKLGSRKTIMYSRFKPKHKRGDPTRSSGKPESGK